MDAALLLSYSSSLLATTTCTQLHGFLGDNSGLLESVVHPEPGLCGLRVIGRGWSVLWGELPF